LRSGSFTVPKRRRLSEIPVEPGKPPMQDRREEDLSDDDDSAPLEGTESSLSQMIVLQTEDGQQITVPVAFLQHLQMAHMEDEDGSQEHDPLEGEEDV